MIEFQTVTALNQNVKALLESQYGLVAVMGEISNLSKPSSGHSYFTLKDKHAQVRCAFFKTHQRINMTLQEGMQIKVIGRLSLFEQRGDYQIIVQSFEEAGTGVLYQQFEALKRKLFAEGLFNAEHKKTLPRFPETIAIVTSPKSAALRDMLITIYKRYPLAEIKIYPVEVQGQTASRQLTLAVQAICDEQVADVILLARGGGSLEDLWAFNDEGLARAIFQAGIPVVTGVGHETDFTIADFVADHRAATPTAAALAVTPDQQVLKQYFKQVETRLAHYLKQQVYFQSKQLTYLENQLTKPLSKLTQQGQTIDYLEQQLHVFMRQKLKQYEQAMRLCTQTLNAFSPLETLNRGYAIATQAGKTLTSPADIQCNEPIELRLAKGKVVCWVILLP